MAWGKEPAAMDFPSPFTKSSASQSSLSAPAPQPVTPVVPTPAQPSVALAETTPPVAVAKSLTGDQGFEEDKPMNIQADEMMYEQTIERLTASGNVDIIQEGRRLQADKVVYDIKADKARAIGSVVLTEPSGDVHMAQEIEMEEAFKRGFVKGLSSILKDGSRLTAKEGVRIDAKKIVLKDAWYTPCKACPNKPEDTPDWNVTADQVTLDEEEHRVIYKNAKFELFGVPVLYTPYLSHPDGTIKQKSGFLTPRFGFGSQLGGFFDTRYYHAIDRDKDATTGIIMTGKEGPVAIGEYRQRFDEAEMSIGGSITESTRPFDENGDDARSNKEVRGHLTGKGEWDMTNKWRANYKLDVASDDQYLRQYKLPREDVLENRLQVERFDERDYSSVKALAFQDTRINRDTEDQPVVLPWAQTEHYTEPKAILGGRGKVGLSTVNLTREGSAQDVQRFTGEANWNRRTVLPLGIVNDTDINARGDLYRTRERFAANTLPDQGSSDTSGRHFAQLHSQFGYPLARRVGQGSHIVEPRVALTVGNDVGDLNDIPNEDSQDVDFSISRLFEANRFAGYDRIDDGTRATYGLSNQYIGDGGHQGEIFLGQSIRLSDEENPFPDGSGLEHTKSDLVGRIRYQSPGGSSLEYGFRNDQETFASRRQDVTMNLNMNPVNLGMTYFYTAPLAGTDLTDDREQILVAPNIKLSDQWLLRSYARYDLSGDENKRGLQIAGIGFDYIGDCITFSADANKNNLDEASGTNETEVFFRIGFKNLAEFETSPITFGGRTEDDALEVDR